MNIESPFVLITWTCGSIDEARRVSRYLVSQKLVACANIIPWIESVFLWEGKIDTAQESKIIFKTRAALFEKVKEVILENSKYEIPEVLMIPILEGNKQYLDWIEESTCAFEASQ